MAHFRILIPNSTAKPADELRRVGLGELLRDDDWTPSAAPLNHGPRGIKGLCISWDGNTCRPGVESPRYEFDANIDEAIESPFQPVSGMALATGLESPPAASAVPLAQGRFWLLIEKSRPVTPADLTRKPADSFDKLLPSATDPEPIRIAKGERLKTLTRYAGNTVTLGDSRSWTFPNQFELPSTFQLNEQGVWGEYVRPTFKTTFDRMVDAFNACQQHILWQLVRDYPREQLDEVLSDDEREFLTEVEPKALDQQVAIGFLCEMLALNYRVTPWLISQLGLLSPSVLWESLMACTDAARLRALYATVQKKIEQIRATGSNTSSGNTAA